MISRLRSDITGTASEKATGLQPDLLIGPIFEDDVDWLVRRWGDARKKESNRPRWSLWKRRRFDSVGPAKRDVEGEGVLPR